jgi:hypothetical protein
VIALVLALVAGALIVGTVDVARSTTRRRAVRQRVRGLDGVDGRAKAISILREEIAARAGERGWLGRRAVEREAAELRVDVAHLLLVDGRADEALDELIALEPDRLGRGLKAALAGLAIEAHLQLGQWDAVERVLDGYAHVPLDAVDRALRVNARARLRIGRGDARAALRLLDEADAPPREAAVELDVTRARSLALEGRAAEAERLLAGLPRDRLSRYAERHAGEPAAELARRILDEPRAGR